MLLSSGSGSGSRLRFKIEEPSSWWSSGSQNQPCWAWTWTSEILLSWEHKGWRTYNGDMVSSITLGKIILWSVNLTSESVPFPYSVSGCEPLVCPNQFRKILLKFIVELIWWLLLIMNHEIIFITILPLIVWLAMCWVFLSELKPIIKNIL